MCSIRCILCSLFEPFWFKITSIVVESVESEKAVVIDNKAVKVLVELPEELWIQHLRLGLIRSEER